MVTKLMKYNMAFLSSQINMAPAQRRNLKQQRESLNIVFHEHPGVNRELQTFCLLKKYPEYGTNHRTWLFSVNLSTKSTAHDMKFSDAQYRGMRALLEHYCNAEMRRRYKKAPAYEEFITYECWRILSRLRDNMYQPAKQRCAELKREFREPPSTEYLEVTDWSNDEFSKFFEEKWAKENQEIIARREQEEKDLWNSLDISNMYDKMEDMRFYLRQTQKAVRMRQLESRAEVARMYKTAMLEIVEMCWAQLPYICDEDFEEEEEELVRSESLLSIDSIDNRPNTPQFETEVYETQGDNADCISEEESSSSSEMDFEISDDQVDGATISLVNDLKFDMQIPLEWMKYVKDLYVKFNRNTEYEQGMMDHVRVFRNLGHVLHQMQQVLAGNKRNKYERAALVYLRYMKQLGALNAPYQCVINTLSFEDLTDMLCTFCQNNMFARKIGLHGGYFQQFMLYSICFEIARFPKEFEIESQAVIQGDKENTGEVLEAIESLEKTANVTMLHERPENQISSHHQHSANTFDQNNVVSESPYTLQQVLKRNIRVMEYNWSTSRKEYDVTYLDFPYCLLRELTKASMRLFAFARFDCKCTVMMNGNKFMKGGLMVGIQPIMFDTDLKYMSKMQLFNFPFGFLQASVSNVLEFTIPYNNIWTLLPQQNGRLREQKGYCRTGRLFFMVVNALEVPQGCPQDLDIEVYAKFENIEMHQTCQPWDAFTYNEDDISIGGVGEPKIIEKKKKDTEFFIQGDDMPIVNRTVELLAQPSGNQRILNVKSDAAAPLESHVMVADELSFEELLKIPSLLDRFTWKLSDEAGSSLWFWYVSPTSFTPERLDLQNLGNVYTPTMLSYISRLFLWYNGDIIIKFQLIKNDFFSARAKIVYDPTFVSNMSVNMSQDYISCVNSAIIDIQQQNEFEVRVPFTSVKSILRCDRFRYRDTNDNYLGEWHTGLLSFIVCNKLVGPPNYEGVVNCNVYIYAADNFRLCIPVPTRGFEPYFGGDYVADKVYPIKYTTDESKKMEFDNKDWIMELYYRGLEMCDKGMLIPSTEAWYRASGIEFNYCLSVYKWLYQINKILWYVNNKPSSNQSLLIGSLQNYPMAEKKQVLQKLSDLEENIKSIRIANVKQDLKLDTTLSIAQGAASKANDNRKEFNKFLPSITGNTSRSIDNYKKIEILKVNDVSNSARIDKHSLMINDIIKSLKKHNIEVDGKTETEILKMYMELISDEIVTQGLERYVTTGDEHPKQILLTKNNRPNHSKVMEHSYRPLREILERFWPYLILRPKCVMTGYFCVTIPVCPYFNYQEIRDINDSCHPEKNMTHLSWVSRCYNYWKGPLKYKIVCNRTCNELFAVYQPNVCEPASARDSIDESEVHYALSYGTDIGVTHVQGGLEVEVPYQSSFDQLLIPKTQIAPDLRWQNGVLKIYARMLYTPADLNFSMSIFIAAGKDFHMSWITPPPSLYMGQSFIYTDNKESIYKSLDLEVSVDNSISSGITPLKFDIPGAAYASQIFISNAKETKPSEDEAVTQGLSDFIDSVKTPFKAIEEMKDAATSMSSSFSDISETLKSTSSVLKTESIKISNNVEETKINLNDKLNTITNDFQVLSGKAGDATDRVAYYVDLTATTMLSGNVIRAFVVAVKKPGTPGVWIDLGLSFAALLGFSIKHIIIKCVQNVLDWFQGNEQIQAQALSGATLNELEENEETILKSVAVLGTILYAYIFECIPNFTNLKKLIKDMLNQDPKAHTQGLNLRGAHFAYLGLSALSKVFDNIIHYTKKFLDWMLERDSPEALLARRAESIKDRVMTLIKGIDFYDNEYEILKALVDPDVHNKMYKLVDEANELSQIYMKENLDTRIGQILTECRTRSKALVKRLESESPTSGWRFDPYIIVIHGESGTGKSHIMHELMRIVAEEWDLPKYNQIYAKTVKDDFWSGYTGQPIIQWDEFGQNPDNDAQAVELVELRSNLPKRLNMAAVHEKGRFFNSKAMFITTNVPYINYRANIRDDVAFKRRRHFMLEMKHKRGFNANVVQELPRFDKTYSHCKFRRTPNMASLDHDRDWAPLEEIKNTIRMEVRAWAEKQMDLYEDYMQNHGLGVIPRGVVHVSQPVKFDANSQDSEALERAITSAVNEMEPYVPFAPINENDPILELNVPLISTSLPNVAVYEGSRQINTPLPEITPIATSHQGTDLFVTKSALEMPEKQTSMCVTQGETGLVADERGQLVKSACDAVPTMSQVHEANPWCLQTILISKNNRFLKSAPAKISTSNLLVQGCVLDSNLSELPEHEQETAKCYVENQNMTIVRYSKTQEDVRKGYFQKVKGVVSSCYQFAKNVFLSIAQSIKNFIKNHPRITIGLSILGALGAVGSVMWLIQKECEPEEHEDARPMWKIARENTEIMEFEEAITFEGKEDEIKKHQLLIKPIYDAIPEHKTYDPENMRPKFKKVLTQGCEDPNAMDIRERVHPNLLIIGWPVGAAKKMTMKCLHLKGRLILVPFHFFAGAREGDRFVLLHRMVPLSIEFVESKLCRIDNKDFCIYDCGARLEPRKDISKYFISESQVHLVPKLSVMLCNLEYNGMPLYASGMARAVKEFKYSDSESGDVYFQDGWEVNMATSVGDCGSFLLGLSKSLPKGKIVGIHTAGAKNKNYGFSVLVTCEMLHQACAQFENVVQCMPMPPQIITSEDALLKIIPEGDYQIYGVMPNKLAPAQPQRTSFEVAPFCEQDVVDIPNLKKPAYLKPFTTIEGERISPLKLALKKYGKKTIAFPQKDMDNVKEFVLNILIDKVKSSGMKILTVEQAVKGIPDSDFAKPLNLVSSPGWPYQVFRKDQSGKHYLFNDDGKIVDNELQKRYDERLKEAKELRRVPSLWRDCLKDELRPLAKVEAGKTRLFTIAPVDFNILVRQYFMDFCVGFYEANCTFFSAVGLDPESIDWTRMYKHLAECGTKTIAGDYGSFDGTLMAELMEMVGDMINEWYNDGDEAAKIRKVLVNEMIHTMQLVENTVYSTHQGNPSGNPLTVIINTIVNFLYLCLAFKKIYPHKTLADFLKFCRFAIYGDDVLITVMECLSDFNQNSLTEVFAKQGIEFTEETKTGTEVANFRELKDVRFLKRGFRKDKAYGHQFWLATMSEETLTSFFHWMRQAPDVEEQLQNNMRACLKFAAFHGKQKYDFYLNKWAQCMRNIDYEPIMITFDEQIDVFHGTVGMICNNPRYDKLFGEIRTEGDPSTMKKIKEKAEEQPSTFRKFCGVAWQCAQVYGWYWLFSKGIEYLQCTGEEFEKRNAKACAQRTDDRFAICIPSGEGKTTLAQKFPHLFIDQDDYVLKPGKYDITSGCGAQIRNRIQEEFGKEPEELSFWEKLKLNQKLPGMYESWVREQDASHEDRRVLLTHLPRNTKRQVLGCFILPQPTGVRNNLAGRMAMKMYNPVVATFEQREQMLLDLVRREEAHLFGE